MPAVLEGLQVRPVFKKNAVHWEISHGGMIAAAQPMGCVIYFSENAQSAITDTVMEQWI